MQPRMQRFHDRPTSCLPNLLVGARRNGRKSQPQSRRVAECGSAPRRRAATSSTQRTGRIGRLMCAQQNARLTESSAVTGQPLETGIAVHLQHAAELRQVRRRTNDLAVLGIHINGDGMRRSTPRPVIDRVAPVSSLCVWRLAQATLARRADPSGATSVALVPRAPALDMCPGGRPRRMPNRKFAPLSASTGVGRRRGGSCSINGRNHDLARDRMVCRHRLGF